MTNPEASRQLVNMFFLGQFVLASMLAPSFAAGAMTSEKEQKTYEMLLASPLKPGAVVLGTDLTLQHIERKNDIQLDIVKATARSLE